MLTSISFSALVAALSFTLVSAAPVTRLTVRETTGPVIKDEYIVKLKDSAVTASHIASLPFAFSVADVDSPVTHEWADDFFRGYSGTFIGAALDAILASPDVEYVEKNQIFSISATQADAGWNLQALSRDSAVGGTDTVSMKYSYTYADPAGSGVDIYIVDTGINAEHVDFEGRATFGYAAGAMQKMDGHGHGTHCAGTAAGKKYGVAKGADIIGVKVLADNGSGSTTDIVDGLNWVMKNVKSTGKPSIASMSLGGDVSQALDDAVTKLITAGVQVVIAAGNSNVDASNTSPARVESAITVAASDIRNAKATFSNFGAAVDVWAPGVNITSTWIGTTTAVKTISGTSMATPQVAGLAAYFLSKDTSMTPAAIFDKIKSLARSDAVSGVPAGTVADFVYNGGGDDDSTPVSPPSSPSLPSLPSPTSITPAPTSTTTTQTKSICPGWWPNCPWEKLFNH